MIMKLNLYLAALFPYLVIVIIDSRTCICVCVSFVCAFTENGKPEDMFSKDYYCISQVMRNYVKGETFSQQD